MADQPEPPAPGKTRVPTPPSREELDQISRDQALITDEWAAPPMPEDGAKP